MSLAAALQFAFRYVSRHRAQSLLLALALGVVLALPAMVRVFATAIETEMRARAASTPQVLGARGSALDLMLTALHFRRVHLAPVTMKAVNEIRASGLAEAIPLHIRYRAGSAPVVGTEMEYFSFRGLRVADGRLFGRLGDCVIGAAVAAEQEIVAGGALFSTPEQVFDIAGSYPLKMRVTGVLAPSHSADDRTVFVDIKTAWLIEGRSHGHDDLARAGGEGDVLKKEEGNVVGNAAVRMFNEVTDANLSGFHFHGDITDYPMTAAIVVPRDTKSEALLAGRYQDVKNPLQLIRPNDELDALLGTLLRVEGAILAGLILAGIAALAVTVIVFALSFKMRAREFCALEDIGIPAGTLRWVKVFETALVGLGGGIIAVLAVMLVWMLAPALVAWSLS